MDEKVLLGWKEAHADVYSKFKQDLEEQLLKPYHQTILDMGDDNAEPLKSVIANLAAISYKDDIDADVCILGFLKFCFQFVSIGVF